jgi:hypothetical protein
MKELFVALLLLLGLRGKGKSAPPSPPGPQPPGPKPPEPPQPPWPSQPGDDVPTFPGEAWEADEPPPPEVVQRAWQLLRQLWAKGEGSYQTELTGGRWITYQAQWHGPSKRGVTAYRIKRGYAGPPGPPQPNGRGGRVAPKGGRVEIRNTGFDEYKAGGGAWAKKRLAVAVAILQRDYVNEVGSPPNVALAMLTHWAIETAKGGNEYNYNLGGIKARAGDQYVSLKASEGGHANFVAYDDLAQSVSDYIGLLRTGYPACWKLLTDKPDTTDWYDCLGKGGYYGVRGPYESMHVTMQNEVLGGGAARGGGGNPVHFVTPDHEEQV